MMLPLAQTPPLSLLLYLESLTDIQKICTKKVVGRLKVSGLRILGQYDPRSGLALLGL